MSSGEVGLWGLYAVGLIGCTFAHLSYVSTVIYRSCVLGLLLIAIEVIG